MKAKRARHSSKYSPDKCKQHAETARKLWRTDGEKGGMIKSQNALKEAFGLTDDESQKVSSALDELSKNPESFIAMLDEELARRRNQKL